MAHPHRIVPMAWSVVALVGLMGTTSCAGATATHRSAHSTEAQHVLPPLAARLARQRIVFVNAVAGAFGAIYSIRLDGQGLRRLATEAYEPAASPDRTQVAYTEGNQFGPGGIFVMRSNGTHKRAVASEGEGIDGQSAWSPDGRKLVFVSTISPSPSGGLFEAHLFTVRADGSRLRRLLDAPTNVDNPGPSWIDAGHILVTAELGELAIISSQTGRAQRRIPLPRAGTQPGPQAAALSPNRKQLAYTECVNDDCSATVLDLITPRGRLIRRISGGRSAAWSPAGDLLYACCQEPSTLHHKSRIFFVPAAGGAPRPITPDSIQADSPAWIG